MTSAPDHSCPPTSNGRASFTAAAIRSSFLEHLRFSLGKHPSKSTAYDRFESLALAVRDRLIDRWIRTQRTYHDLEVRRVHFLSLEYLPGRALMQNILNLGIHEQCRDAAGSLGLELSDLVEQEADAGLGNGGLGRLAACFADSLATLSIPAVCYGIRYEFGIFRQVIWEGQQVEQPDEWLRAGNPWEIERPEYTIEVNFGGHVEHRVDRGKFVAHWVPTDSVLGVPYDTPIAGYGTYTVNTMRLWQARSSEQFDLSLFNHGDYIRAVEEKNLTENISKVLYPNDEIRQGKELRLKQEYFFVACALRDIIRRYLESHTTFDHFADRVAVQLNDTHPALAVAELMRLLVDEHALAWQDAWETTVKVFAYTNHTLLPEALERWPVDLFEQLLPRHLEIIYEINRRFLREVLNRYPMDHDRLARMSIIEEGPVRQVRMAHLAVIGSHSVNGVAELHTRLLQTSLMPDFYDLWPRRFNSKTNGVTQRRWLLQSNPALAEAITRRVGDGWVKNLYKLRDLIPMADDAELQHELHAIKQANKLQLAEYVWQHNHIRVDPSSIFDVQVKRLHEYKRQLLNALHIVSLYHRIRLYGPESVAPRTFIFSGKSAPGYRMAKLIIRFINAVAAVVNEDGVASERLRVVFLENYRVSLAERIIPAADVSEQISTAGMEASGTGNMKFSLNGALTVGTLDGANIEIREEVGEENFFDFGLTVEEIEELRRVGYNPLHVLRGNEELQGVINLVHTDFFSPDDPALFRPISDSLVLHGDRFFVLADFASYAACQRRVAETYAKPEVWFRKAILNIANMGKFSSDETIRRYCEEIWRVRPVQVSLVD
ncbi:MAG: glycogen/starch/alpha-glucan phosphorylase [Candidatus Schekmanbacteria bacterium]|nr:glycogen/starch/alpha-glucan phosphorylase [Candidatus Schekmanbacteria bacterium]